MQDPDPQHWVYYTLSIKPLNYLLSICFLLGMFSTILLCLMETELDRSPQYITSGKGGHVSYWSIS